MKWEFFRRDKWRRRDRLFLPLILLLIFCSPILILLFCLSVPFIFCSVATARFRSASRKGLKVHESEEVGVPQVVGTLSLSLLERYLEDQFRLVKVRDQDWEQRSESAPMMDMI